MKNKLTQEDIQNVIVDEKYHRLTSKLTVCVLTLVNGFEVTGESACVDPANYHEDIGNTIARENAFEKVWMLEGYLLQDKLHKRMQLTKFGCLKTPC